MGLVGKLLLLSALGCGATGVLLLQAHATLGLALCAVALCDLALVAVLRWRAPAGALDAGLPSP